MLRLLVFITVLAAISGAAVSAPAAPGFADTLFSEGNYYDAQTEYMRFLHFNPGSDTAAGLRIRIALCDLYRNDPYGAVRRLSSILTSGTAGDTEPRLRLTLARLYTQLGHYNIAHMHLDAAEKDGTPETAAAARWYRTWTWLCQNRADTAQAILAQVPPSTAAADELSASISALQHLPQTSPGAAGWMSFILPGSGQVYAGEPVQGLGSFLVNAGFAAWFANMLVQKKYGEAAAVYVFGWARFHLGGVRNARQAARNRNHERRSRALDGLTEKFRFSLTPDTEKDIY